MTGLLACLAAGGFLALAGVVHDLLYPPPDPMDAHVEEALALTRPVFAHELRAHEYGEVDR